MVKKLNEELDFDVKDDIQHDLYNAVAKVMFRYRRYDISAKEFEDMMEYVTVRFEDGVDYDFSESVKRPVRESSDKKWLNTEVTKDEYKKLKKFLVDNGIKHEASGAYNLIHVEVYVDEYEKKKVNDFIDKINESYRSKKKTKNESYKSLKDWDNEANSFMWDFFKRHKRFPTASDIEKEVTKMASDPDVRREMEDVAGSVGNYAAELVFCVRRQQVC